MKLSEILKLKDFKADRRNAYEFQAYGNRLSDELHDPEHRTLYIKLAKNENRDLLETARTFVLNQEHVDRKGKLFMWKLQQLKELKANEKKPNI